MIEQLFAVMNEVLDEISAELPAAYGVRKQQLLEKLNVLRAMSGNIIDEWMVLEEKLAYCHQLAMNSIPAVACDAPVEDDCLTKGMGYFQLMMFADAIRHFERFVHRHPDSLTGRLYLALSYLQNKNYDDAYRHFQILLPLTNDGKIKAVSYNAMACIHYVQHNTEKAKELFRLAHELDPGLKEPIVNMDICLGKEGNP